ncbi:hypothetical protein [Actinacidiphila soli]|uniref:hypothetical protein n=1 Tax=Actinacidiphila soli TaxID=2487275 RepID=UPI0019D13662|nr:hypothetical protein [Actinacidiphila soli]
MTGVLTTIHANPQVTAQDTGQYRQVGRSRVTPFQVIGGIFWVVVSVQAWRTPIAADFGQHAAAIERVKADWLHPANPLLDIPGHGSPYFTPYTVALGLLAKATGLAGWEVLKACGPLNLAVVVTGIAAFTRTLSARRWAPVLALAAFVLLWGPVHMEWSGFLGLQSLIRGVTYPSALAVGLTFHLWALTARHARPGPRPGPWVYAGVGILYGLVVLIHPITALGTGIGMAALLVGRQRRWNRTATERWALAAAVAFAVAAWWPYFSVFALAGDATVDRIHRPLYGDLWGWYGLALAGLPALVWRARRDLLDPLVVMFVLGCGVAAYGWLSGHYTYGRIFGVLLVPLQFSLAVELADVPRWTPWHRLLVPLAAVAACTGLVAQAGAVVPQRYEPVALQRVPHWPSYRWAADRIPVGDTVLAHGYVPTHALPAYGVFLVAPTWPDPSTAAAVRLRRQDSVRAYFAAGVTPTDRSRIARTYHAKWVLTLRDEPAPADGTLAAASSVTGERLFRLGRRPSPPGRPPSGESAEAYGSSASRPTGWPGRTPRTSGSPPGWSGPAR